MICFILYLPLIISFDYFGTGSHADMENRDLNAEKSICSLNGAGVRKFTLKIKEQVMGMGWSKEKK